MAVNEDVTMGDPLASLCTACAETEALNNIVKATLKQAQHIFTGNALHVRCHIIVLAELGLENTVCSAAFLLFTELGAVFGSLASPCLTVLSRRSVTLHNSALCFVVAAIAFKKQFGAFPAALSANGISISCHNRLLSLYSSTLGRTAAIMRNGGDVLDHVDFKTCSLERADCRFTTCAGALDVNFNDTHAVFH